jgi:CheY-like chemotaxis protein
MPSGGKLVIATRNTEVDEVASRYLDLKPGEYVCLTVADTGSGMTPEVIARAFDPFFTTKPIGQGTGLGLSMVYGFAKQSGGHVRVESAPDKGATVELYLPRYAGTERQDAELASSSQRSQLPTQARREAQAGLPLPVGNRVGVKGTGASSGTVLIIEDEGAVRDLVLDVVAELGLPALSAGDGPAALEILRSDAAIDLVVTDLGLPGMNGRALADAARALRPGLKFLFITGYAENAALARGFLAPGMAMLTKPFAIDALAARIRQMLGDDGIGEAVKTPR